MSIADDGEKGYILEVDLEYPEELTFITSTRWHRLVSFSFIEFKGFPRQDLRSPDRGDLRNGFV